MGVPMRSAGRGRRVPVPARPLAGEHEQQQQRQVPQAAEEQSPRAPAVCVHIEAEAEVGDVRVDGKGHEGEGPRGDVQDRGCCGQHEQGQAVAQRHAPAQARMGDRHHAVAAPGVVFTEAPAEGVEMRKLPGVEDSSQEKCTSIEAARGRCPAHDRRDGPNHGSDPCVDNADPLQWCVAAGIQKNIEEPQGSCEWIHPPGQNGNSRNSTTSGKGHS